MSRSSPLKSDFNSSFLASLVPSLFLSFPGPSLPFRFLTFLFFANPGCFYLHILVLTFILPHFPIFFSSYSFPFLPSSPCQLSLSFNVDTGTTAKTIPLSPSLSFTIESRTIPLHWRSTKYVTSCQIVAYFRLLSYLLLSCFISFCTVLSFVSSRQIRQIFLFSII